MGTSIATGRYIMVRKNEGINDYLSLAELQAFSSGVNVAQGKTVMTSGSYDQNWHRAANLVDGNTATSSGIYASSTAGNGWIQIDLGSVMSLDSIKLFGRTDGSSSQDGNFSVYVSNTSLASLTTAQIENTAGVYFARQVGVATMTTFATPMTLHGSAQADRLVGDANANVIDGGAGNDTIDGGQGADTLVGGAGNDTIITREADYFGNHLISVDAGADNDTIQVMGVFATQRIDGGTGTDTVDFSQSNVFLQYGTGGVRYRSAEHAGVNIDFSTGQGWSYYVNGNGSTFGSTWMDEGGRLYLSNIENLKGTQQADRLIGSAGANVIDGGGGADYLSGGAGDDMIITREADYFGNHLISVDAGADNDTIQVMGVFATQRIDGGTGTDTVDFSQSNVFLQYGTSAVRYRSAEHAGVNIDLSTGQGWSYYYDNNGVKTNWADEAGHLYLSNIENVKGTQEADRLIGNAAANWLVGGAGNDLLEGGAGNDTLEGGTGSDTYVFKRNSGRNIIIENTSNPGDNDVLQFGPTIQAAEIWFSRSGNDLLVSLTNTSDSVLIRDWYVNSEHRIEQFVDTRGYTLDADEVIHLTDVVAAVQSGGNVAPEVVPPYQPRAVTNTSVQDTRLVRAVRQATWSTDPVDVPNMSADEMRKLIQTVQPSFWQKSVSAVWMNALSAGAWKELNQDVFALLANDVVAGLNSAKLQIPLNPVAGQKISDPFYKRQWHFDQMGRLGYGDGTQNRLGIEKIWQEYTGKKISAAVLEKGRLDAGHWDLIKNYDSSKEATVNGKPVLVSVSDHTTSVAGIFAASNNGLGGVGVAYDAKITSIPSAGAVVSPNLISQIINFDIINRSEDYQYATLTNIDDLGLAIRNIIFNVARTGRSGLGSIYVQSAGNEGPISAVGEYTRDLPFTILVGALSKDSAMSTASYSQHSPNMLISAPVEYKSKTNPTEVTTTAMGGKMTSLFDGTSAAAPQVSGVVALMLQAAPSLGWRDVQSILAYSAIGVGSVYGTAGKKGDELYDWKWNGANNWNGGGLHYSEDYGYGMLNAYNAVRMAEVWGLFGSAQTMTNVMSAGRTDSVNLPLIYGKNIKQTFSMGSRVAEYATVELNLNHPRYSDVKAWLTSPSGTRIQILDGTTEGSGQVTYKFGLQGFRGENAAGVWTVEIEDGINQLGSDGTVNSIGFNLFATPSTADPVYHYTNEVFQARKSASATHPTQDYLMGVAGTRGWIDASAMPDDIKIDLSQKGIATSGGIGFMRVGADGNNINNIVTGDGNDTLTGDAKDNQIYGMRGNDRIYASWGADTLDGGAGIDRLDYSRLPEDVKREGVNVNLKTGAAVKATRLPHDQIQNFEDLKGSNLNDFLVGSDGDNVFFGGHGNDTIVGNLGINTVDYSEFLMGTVDGRGIDVNLTNNKATKWVPGIALKFDGFVAPYAVDVGCAVCVADLVFNSDSLLKLSGKAIGRDGGATLIATPMWVDRSVTGQVKFWAVVSDYSYFKGVEVLLQDTETGISMQVLSAKHGPKDQAFCDLRTEGTVVSVASSLTVGDYGLSSMQLSTTTTGVDLLVAIQNVVGTAYHDNIMGDKGSNTIFGSRGSDVIDGAAGVDTLDYSRTPYGTGVEADLSRSIVAKGQGSYGIIRDTFVPPGILELSSSLKVANLYLERAELILDGGLINGNGISAVAKLIDRSVAGQVKFWAVGVDSINGVFTKAVQIQILDAGQPGGDPHLISMNILGAKLIAGNKPDYDFNSHGMGDIIKSIAYSKTDLGYGLSKFTINGNGDIDQVFNMENIIGSPYDDFLVGNAGDNVLSGGEGQDILKSGGGADTLKGGAGDDSYFVTDNLVQVQEQADEGIDTVKSTISYKLTANVENLELGGVAAINGEGNSSNNKITGNVAINVILGGDGNDTLDGGGGADTLNGGQGDDTYIVNSSLVQVFERANEGLQDTVKSSVGYTLTANVENLELVGVAAIDGEGNSLNNIIIGNSAANVLRGKDGNDTLSGGAGNDTLSGGFGSDTFIFDRNTGVDTVQDISDLADINIIKFGDNISINQLWFSRSFDGNNGDVLDIKIIGTSDNVRVFNGETPSTSGISRIETADHHYLDLTQGEAKKLADAMTSYTMPTVTSIDGLSQYAAIKTLMDSTWHAAVI